MPWISGDENGVSSFEVTEFSNTHPNTLDLATLKERIRVLSVSHLSGE